MAFPVNVQVDYSEGGSDLEDCGDAPPKGVKGRPSFLCRRGNCPSFRMLLRRQLWSGSVRVATSLGRLFRSRRSLHNKRKPEATPPPTPPAADTVSLDELSRPAKVETPNLVKYKSLLRTRDAGGSGSGDKIAPAEPVVKLKTLPDESPPRRRRVPWDKKSKSSTFDKLFRKAPRPATPSPPSTPSVPLPLDQDIGHIRLVRSKRLMREFQEMTKQYTNAKDPMFSIDLVNDSLYEWKVKLYKIDPDSELARDMVEFNIKYILLNVSFPETFPFQPPFLRVLAPQLEKGFVMDGGAICMELLTPRGWASAYTIEAVLMQFAASVVKGQGRVSRRHSKPSKDFNKRSAEASFKSLVKTHDKYGWVTPPLAEG